MATFSYGSRNGYSFDGFRPPYKIGKSFTFPTISDRSAPGQTGSAAQPCLAISVGIEAQGNGTNTPSTRFALWDSNGANGYYSTTFNLTAQSSTNSNLTTATLSTPKPIFGNTTYIVGFSKLNTETFQWDVDTTKAGNIIRDNNSDSGNFTNSANYEPGSLVFRITYYVIPLAPSSVVATKGSGGVDLNWTAPTDNGGTAITGYRVDRSPDGSVWTNIVANTNSVATTYTDTSAISGNTYYYRVAAHNLVTTTHGGSYSSPYSASSSAFTYITASANNATSTLRADVINTSVTATEFSDDGTGIPFSAVEVSYGSEQLYNYVSAEGVTTEVAEALVSQTLYGKRSYTVTGLLNTNSTDIQNVANEILWSSYKPFQRISSINVILNSLTETQKNTVIGLDLDSLIRVTFTPNNVGTPFFKPEGFTARIIGIDYEVTLDLVTIKFSLDSAEEQVFTLDSEAFGYLDKDILG